MKMYSFFSLPSTVSRWLLVLLLAMLLMPLPPAVDGFNLIDPFMSEQQDGMMMIGGGDDGPVGHRLKAVREEEEDTQIFGQGSPVKKEEEDDASEADPDTTEGGDDLATGDSKFIEVRVLPPPDMVLTSVAEASSRMLVIDRDEDDKENMKKKSDMKSGNDLSRDEPKVSEMEKSTKSKKSSLDKEKKVFKKVLSGGAEKKKSYAKKSLMAFDKVENEPETTKWTIVEATSVSEKDMSSWKNNGGFTKSWPQKMTKSKKSNLSSGGDSQTRKVIVIKSQGGKTTTATTTTAAKTTAPGTMAATRTTVGGTTSSETTAARTTVGGTTASGTTAAITTVGETTASETTAARTTVGGTTASGTTASGTTASGTTAARTTVGGTTATDTTAARTTAAGTTAAATVKVTATTMTTDSPTTAATDLPTTAATTTMVTMKRKKVMTWVKPSALTLKKTASKKEEEKKKIKIEQKADKKENMKKKVRGGKKRSEVKTSMTSTVEVVRASSSEVEEDGVHGRSLGIDSILQKKKMPGPMVTTSLGGGTILTRKQLSDQGVIVVDNPFLTNKKDKPAQKSGPRVSTPSMGNPTTPPNLFADLPSKPSPIPPSASSLTQEQKINKEWMPKVRIHRPRTVVPPPPGVAEQLRNRPPPPPPPPPPSRNPNWSPIVIVDFPPSRTRAPPPPPPPQFTPSYPDKFKNQRNRNPQKLQRLQQQQQQPPMMMYSNNNNNILMNSNMAPPMRSRPQLPPQQRLPGYGPPSPTMLQNHIRMPQKSAPIKFFPPTRVVISQEDELLPPGVSNSLYKGGFLPPTRAQLSQQQAERFPPSSTKAVDMYATVPTKSSMMVPERLQKQQQQQQQRSPPRMSLTQMTPGIPQKTPHMVSLTRGTVAMPLQQQTPHKVSMTDSNKGMPMVSRQQQQQQQQSPPRMSMTDKDPRLIHPTARVMSANSNDIKDKHSNNNNMRMKKYMIEVMMPDQVSANPFQSAVREITGPVLTTTTTTLSTTTVTATTLATPPEERSSSMGGMGSSYPSPQADFLVSTLLFADPLNAHLSEEEKDQIRMSYVYESRLVDEDSKVENDGSFEVADTPATPPLTHFAQLLAFKKAMSKNQPTSRWNPDDQRRPQKPRRPEEEATTELPSTSLPSTPVPLPPPTMSEFGMGSFFSNFGKSQEANEIQEDVTTNPPFTTASMFKDFTTDHPYSAGNVFKDTPRFRHEPDFSEDEDPGSVGVESPHMNQPSSEFKDYDMDKAKKAFKTFPDYSYEGDFSEDDQTPEDVALQRLKQQTFDPFKEDNHEDFTTDHPYSAGNVFKDEQPDFRQIESDFSSAETDEQHSVDMMELQRLNRPSADMHRMKSHQDFTTVPPFPARSSVDVTQDLRQESEVVDEEEAAASGNGEPRHLSWPSSSSSRKKTSHKKKTKDHRHSSQKNRFKDHRGYKHHSHSEDRHEPRPAHDHEESKHSYRPSHSAEPQDLQRERKPKVAPFRDVQEKPKKEEGFNFHNNFFSNFEKMAGTSFGEMPGPGFGKMSGPSFSQGFDFENFFVGDLINGNKGRGSKFPAFGDESKSNEDDYNGYGYQDEESSSMMSGYDKKTRGYHAKDSPSYHKKPMRGYHAKETRNSGVGYDKKPKAQSSVGYDKGSMGYHAESPSSYNKEPMRGYHEKDMPSFGGGYGKKPKGYHAKDSLSSSGYDKEPRGSYHTIGTGSGYGSSHYGSEGRYPHASGYGHDSYYGKKEHDNGGIYGNSASHGNSGKNSKYPAYGDKPKSTADHNNSYGYKSKNAPSTTKAPMSHQYKKPYHNSGKETTTAMPKAVVSQLKKKKPHTYGEQYMPYMKKEEPHHMVGGGGNSGSGNLYQFPSVRDEVNGYNDYGPKPTGSTGYGKKENRYQYSNPYHKQNSGSTTGFGNYHEDPYPSGYGEKYQLKEQRDKKVTMHPPAPRGTQSTPPQQKKKTQKEEPHLITPSPEMDMDNFGPDKGMFKEFPSFPKPSFMSDFPTFSFTDFEDSMSGFSPKFMDSFGHNSDAEGPGPKSKRGSLSGKKKAAAADHHGGIHRAPLSTASPQDSQAPFGFNSLQGFDSFAPDNSNFFGGGRRLKKEAAPSLRISSLPSKWDTRVASYEEGDTETQLVPKGRPSIFRDDILSSSPSFTSPGGEPKATEIRALPFQPPPTGSGHQDTTRGLQELPPEFSANVAQNIGGRSVPLPKAENEDSDGTVDFGGASGPEGSFGWYSEHSVEKE